MILDELIKEKHTFFTMVKELWLNADDTFPEFLPVISSEAKSSNEDYLTVMIDQLHKQIKKYHRIPFGRKQWVTQTFALLNEILYQEEILGMHHYMNQIEIDAFVIELLEFMKTAREFAPELQLADIGQAIRNYIVYAMFKRIHRVETGFDLAGFGYSMLYPFTDNYIDNVHLTPIDKSEYNRLIKEKLLGLKVTPKSMHHEKTCQLLQYIEDLYPRDRDSYVYSLLLMMLEAQELSIQQQNNNAPLSNEERLDISIYKGGISVLMDRFFVNKELSLTDVNFYLGFGFFLQLADDLQDIKEDSGLGHSNLFTLNLCYEAEEKTVNKLFHFLHQIMETYPAEREPLKNFLMLNSFQLIYSSVLRSKEFFSQAYLQKIELHLPVTGSYWENLMSNRIELSDEKSQRKYLSLLDSLLP